MIHLGKRAALSDALVVLCGVMAYDLRLFHLNAEMLPYKVNGRKDGEEGIPLAAAWTSDLADRLNRFCRHFVGQCKRLIGQGRRLRNDGHKHPCADSRTKSRKRRRERSVLDSSSPSMRCEDQCLRLRCGMQSAMPLLPSHDAPDRAYDRWAAPSSVQ